MTLFRNIFYSFPKHEIIPSVFLLHMTRVIFHKPALIFLNKLLLTYDIPSFYYFCIQSKIEISTLPSSFSIFLRISAVETT